MKRMIFLLVIALAVSSLSSSISCSPRDEYEIKPAPIHELKILFAESYPVQVMLYIKGGLADSATELNEIKVEKRLGNIIPVTVTTKRLKGAVAAQVYGYFERTVNLGSSFNSGEAYTVRVNDMTVDFTMP